MFSPNGTLISASAAPHCGRLRETFIKRYTVERTNKAEISPEEQSEKAESCRENLWNEIVNGCFEPSQPLGIISGLKETFIKRYIVERTNKHR